MTANLNPNRALPPAPQSHEAYILAVRDVIINAHPNVVTRDRMTHIKVVYGTGSGMGARGVTYYSTWKNGKPAPVDTVEVCAFGEESPVQLVGTTIHELAHVVAGYKAGHGAEWKATCSDLGLIDAEAAGMVYTWDAFDSRVREALQAIPTPTDGTPAAPWAAGGSGPLVPVPGMRPRSGPRPCPLGIGTRGGKSRGAGSGSRLRLWHCQCPRPVKVRVASDTFDATCNVCKSAFTRAGG
jgi:hypothetical protein